MYMNQVLQENKYYRNMGRWFVAIERKVNWKLRLVQLKEYINFFISFSP